jgi:hypothetical protein
LTPTVQCLPIGSPTPSPVYPSVVTWIPGRSLQLRRLSDAV